MNISLTINGAVQASGIARSKLYELIASGQIDARKQGRRTLVIADSLRRHIEALPPITAHKRAA